MSDDLQQCNIRLRRCIEELKEKQEDLDRRIRFEEDAKARLQKDLGVVQDRLAMVNKAIEAKTKVKDEYNTIIEETREAYRTIWESSNTLLQFLIKRKGKLQEKSGVEDDDE